MKECLVGLFVLAVLVSTPVYADRTLIYTCEVIGAVNGNTVAVSNKMYRGVLRDSSRSTLHLDAVNAPELDQRGGKEAKEWLGALLAGKDVFVVEHLEGSESSGAWLFVGDERISVNLLLVEKGWAWKTEPKVKAVLSGGTLQGLVRKAYVDMKSKEMDARNARVGIWADDNPIPPWEWRKKHPKKEAAQPEE